MRKANNIVDAIKHPEIFGPFFKDLKTWRTWVVFLKALFALRMGKREAELYRECTGRESVPSEAFREAFVIVGRRGGKSFMMAVIAVYLAFTKNYQKYLAPGEMATILIIATDKPQANIIMGYIKSLLLSIPLFEKEIDGKIRALDVTLKNRVQIMIRTCSYSAVRGYTLAAVILEEVSFWITDGVNPDYEVLTALRPGLATIPGAMLLAISSPYGRNGILYEAYRDNFGKDESPILIWRAATRVMNPTIGEDYIEKELAKDPEAARAEWLAEFRKDLESFLPLEWIQKATIPDRFELPPARFTYQAFADPSGGAQDAFTLSIAHREKDKIVQDLLRRTRSPFNPQVVVKEYVDLLRQYNVREVTGDRYAGAWVSQSFEDNGIRYIASEKSKSDLYLNFEPLLAQGKVELLDDRILFNELRMLERRTGRSGKDSVDHPPRGSDDSANSTAGVIVSLETFDSFFSGCDLT